jgi:hypothetical protein
MVEASALSLSHFPTSGVFCKTRSHPGTWDSWLRIGWLTSEPLRCSHFHLSSIGITSACQHISTSSFLGFFFFFFWLLLFLNLRWFHCVSLAVLELTMSNSQSFWLCLPSAEIKGLNHYTFLVPQFFETHSHCTWSSLIQIDWPRAKDTPRNPPISPTPPQELQVQSLHLT